MLSSDNDSDDGLPPQGTVPVISQSPSKAAVPAALTSVAILVQPGEPNEWVVRAGDDVPKFLFANGPGNPCNR